MVADRVLAREPDRHAAAASSVTGLFTLGPTEQALAAVPALLPAGDSSAAEAGAGTVSHEHLLRAIETQQLGGEVSAVKGLLSESTRERLADHEAGHALVGHWLQLGAVERVTIEPRGQALGVTCISRDSGGPLYAQAELSNRLAMMVGGREAELLVKGSVSSGASDDLKRASELAINMVGSLGFSTIFGLLSVAGVPKDLLGPDIQAALLEEARTMLEQAQAQCQQMLSSRRGQLDALAQALLQREVLSGDELRGLLAGRQAPRVQEALPGSEALRRGRRGLFAGAQCIGPSRRRLLDAEPGRCALAGLARPPNRIRKGTPP